MTIHSMELPVYVSDILSRLNQCGFEAYVVGGCVRDTCIGKSPNDWDICTSALPVQMKEVFRGCHMIDTGIKHGTVTVVNAGKCCEITTFRIDGTYSDGRHPDQVQFSHSLQEDLARRDFTINAMAYSPEIGLVDPFHGLADLQNACIRCVGIPIHRFSEDALRILRAARFAAVYGYRIDPETAAAMIALAPTLSKVSRERIQQEVIKLLEGKYAADILESDGEISAALTVLSTIIPEILPCIGFEQHHPRHLYDVWQHTIRAMRETSNDVVIRLAILFHDLGKPPCFTVDEHGTGHFYGHAKVSAEIARSRMTHLHFPTHKIKTVTELVLTHHDQLIPTAYSVRKFISKYGIERLEQFLIIRRADWMAQNPKFTRQDLLDLAMIRTIIDRIQEHHECVSLKTLPVNGSDLIAIGYPAGKTLGKELKKLLDLVLEKPEQNDREILLEIASQDFIHIDPSQSSN